MSEPASEKRYSEERLFSSSNSDYTHVHKKPVFIPLSDFALSK